MGDVEHGSIDEMFKLLESNRKSVVEEIQRLIYQQFSESKDSAWLINGLYDYYASTQSLNGLKLLLNIKEPLDTVLCDRIAEGLKSCDLQIRSHAVDMLGYISRKQPTWIHKLTQHHCFRELIKLLRYEVDVVVLVTSLLVLLTLLPAIPVKVSPYLNELFEVFGRLAVFLNANNCKDLPSMHLHVAFYAYFNRLYGMYPCNFLGWLRQQYPYTGKESCVFSNVVSPLLSTVRMHPLLVTQSKDHEKSAARWKGLGEVHDVLAECSRYSLDIQECGSREDSFSSSFLDLPPLTPGSTLAASMDFSWTPGKFFDPTSPPSRSTAEKKKPASLSMQNYMIESPPEAAIEATPENTPYATPLKDEVLKMSRKPPSASVVRNLMKSPDLMSPGRTPASPHKDKNGKEASPFRWPEVERRDSVFSEMPANLLAKRDSLCLGRNESSLVSLMKGVSADRGATAEGQLKEMSTDVSVIQIGRRDSLKPEKGAVQSSEVRSDDQGSVILPDYDVDTEVSSLTKSGEGRLLHSRHITPHIFPDSAGGSTPLTPVSRTQSRMGAGSTNPFQGGVGGGGGTVGGGAREDPSRVSSDLGISESPSPFCSIGSSALPAVPVSTARQEALAVDEFVRSVRKRVRYITLCEPEDDGEDAEAEKKTLARSHSCPSLTDPSCLFTDSKLRDRSPVKSVSNLEDDVAENKPRSSSNFGTQTEEGLMLLPWEHLFPTALPLHPVQAESPKVPDPYTLLDKHIEAAVRSLDKSGDPSILRDEISLLHSQLLFERQRREVLGARNRRLLGKTKKLRDLEEQNLALTDQLQMTQSEICTLHNQLASLRLRKDLAESRWSSSTKEQEQNRLQLKGEVEDLKLRIRDLETSLQESLKKESDSNTEAVNSKAELFQVNAKLEKYKGKESRWERTEQEMERLKKQMILQSELIKTYKEKLDCFPSKTNEQQIRLITETALHETATIKSELITKNSELIAATATIADLEEKTAASNRCLDQQKLYLAEAQEEYRLNLQAAEERQASMRSINAHLEMSVLELQEKLERTLKMNRKGRKAMSPSSDSLDLYPNLHHVNSGTSSIHGSVGSDPGEHIRRAIEAPNPIHLQREIARQNSPEIGSAQSAHPYYSGAQSPTSDGSLNGDGH